MTPALFIAAWLLVSEPNPPFEMEGKGKPSGLAVDLVEAAMELAGDNITVNAICPGPVHTVMNDRRIAYDAQRRGIAVRDLEAGLTPIGRRLEPEEIAPLAVYLASDAAAAMIGQAINLDGGVLMTG